MGWRDDGVLGRVWGRVTVAWSIVVAVYAGSGGWGGEITSYSGGLGAGFPAL